MIGRDDEMSHDARGCGWPLRPISPDAPRVRWQVFRLHLVFAPFRGLGYLHILLHLGMWPITYGNGGRAVTMSPDMAQSASHHCPTRA
jgi:hypothetical protein